MRIRRAMAIIMIAVVAIWIYFGFDRNDSYTYGDYVKNKYRLNWEKCKFLYTSGALDRDTRDPRDVDEVPNDREAVSLFFEQRKPADDTLMIKFECDTIMNDRLSEWWH